MKNSVVPPNIAGDFSFNWTVTRQPLSISEVMTSYFSSDPRSLLAAPLPSLVAFSSASKEALLRVFCVVGLAGFFCHALRLAYNVQARDERVGFLLSTFRGGEPR